MIIQKRLLNEKVGDFTHKVPRFAQTLKEASKPALTQSYLINRPFGFDTKKRLETQSSSGLFSLFRLSLFNKEEREKRQKQIDHDIAHSPFYESKSFTNTNGKIFTPPVSYFKKEKSKFFPTFNVVSLDGSENLLSDVFEGKLSILRLYSTVSGEQCVNSFFKYKDVDYLSHDSTKFGENFPLAQIVDINVPENVMKLLLVNLSKSSIRNTLPPARQERYFICSPSTFSTEMRQVLKCDNVCSGYIYLIDNNGKIRWATSGYANDKELDLMWRCVSGLHKELNSLSK